MDAEVFDTDSERNFVLSLRSGKHSSAPDSLPDWWANARKGDEENSETNNQLSVKGRGENPMSKSDDNKKEQRHDQKRPLYPPVLDAWSRGWPSVPPLGYGDMSYDPTVIAGPNPHANDPMTQMDIDALALLPSIFPSRREREEPNPEEFEPLYPLILETGRHSLFSGNSAMHFADMCFIVNCKFCTRHKIDESAELSPPDRRFVDYIQSLLDRKRK